MALRDIALAELTRGRVHIAHMSARQTLDAVRYGKSRGVRVTCEVTPHHFVLTDEMLAAPVAYDTNVKMNPPLRETADRDAMLAGLADGSVDVIATDHAPHAFDEKHVEFDRAPFGITGLETAVSLCFDRLVHRGVVSLTRLVELLSVNPARILSLPGGSLVGRRAGRHLDSGARPGGDRRGEDDEVEVEEHAVRRLEPPRRCRGDDRRRPRRLPESGFVAEDLIIQLSVRRSSK